MDPIIILLLLLFPGGKAAGAWRRAIPLLPLWAFVACSTANVTCTFIEEITILDTSLEAGT